MKRILSLALLLAGVVSTQPALAGNYSPAPHMREPVTPPPSPWEGWFAGLHAGYGIGDVTIGGPPGAIFPIGTDPEGPLFGGQLGYNFQNGQTVYGFIADFSMTNMTDVGRGGIFGPPTLFETEYDWIATLRGRVGRLVGDKALVYGHAGLGYTETGITEVGGVGPFAGVSGSGEQFGYVLGAGVEMMAGERVSIFAEYSYMDFEDPSPIPTAFGPLPIDAEPVHVLKLGVNYHF